MRAEVGRINAGLVDDASAAHCLQHFHLLSIPQLHIAIYRKRNELSLRVVKVQADDFSIFVRIIHAFEDHGGSIDHTQLPLDPTERNEVQSSRVVQNVHSDNALLAGSFKVVQLLLRWLLVSDMAPDPVRLRPLFLLSVAEHLIQRLELRRIVLGFELVAEVVPFSHSLPDILSHSSRLSQRLTLLLCRFNRGVIVPFALASKFNRVEHLNIAHEARHDKPALFSVQQARNLGLG